MKEPATSEPEDDGSVDEVEERRRWLEAFRELPLRVRRSVLVLIEDIVASNKRARQGGDSTKKQTSG